MIQLNYRDSKPIYEQVKDSIRKMIILGAILPGEKVPSVRELAASLAINPNTISKAYRELEQEGYLFTESGKGTFVTEDAATLAKRREALLGKFDDVVSELIFLSVEPLEMKEKIDCIAKEKLHD